MGGMTGGGCLSIYGCPLFSAPGGEVRLPSADSLTYATMACKGVRYVLV